MVTTVVCVKKATTFPQNLMQLGLNHSKAVKSSMHIPIIRRSTTPCFTVCPVVKDARNVSMTRHACSHEIFL